MCVYWCTYVIEFLHVYMYWCVCVTECVYWCMYMIECVHVCVLVYVYD